jgi:putative ABC transport system permease protein
MDSILRDFRYALRSLARVPAFTGATVLCLALGIGANTAIFSVIDAVLIRPIPVHEPSGIVMVWERFDERASERNVVSPANYLDWKAQAKTIADIGAFVDWRAALTGDDDPEQLHIAIATAEFFSVLGVPPQLGRTYDRTQAVPGGPEVVVLSDELWRRRYNADPRILGRRILLDGDVTEVIGVMPPGFGYPGSRAEAWAPLRLDPSIDYRTRSGRYLMSVARLAPGATPERAQAELSTIAARLADAHPRFNKGWGVNVVPLREQVVGSAQRALLVLGGVVAFVLLIACANVANLQVARATARQRDIAVRAALGASRGAVVRQLLAESVLLGVLGGGLGLLLALWGTSAMAVSARGIIPRATEIGMDARTLAFTAGLALLTGVIVGLVPALHATRSNLQSPLREGGRGSTRGNRTRSLLVGAQVALSLVLLVGAGLLLRSFARLTAVDPGFDPRGVLTARLDLTSKAHGTPAQQVAFFENVIARIRQVPEVESVSAVNWLPFTGLASATSMWVDGRPIPEDDKQIGADVRAVHHDYFRTMQMRVLRGEPFGAEARANTPKKVVVNETFVKSVFPGEDPIGRVLKMPWGDTLTGEIVAVVADSRHAGLDSLPKKFVYWALPQFPYDFMTLVVRGRGDDPMRLAPAVRAAVREMDPNLPLSDLKPMEAWLGDSVARRRFVASLLAIFSGVALVLAGVGIYGVLAYGVAQRTREIGVRLALGAGERRVQRQVVLEGMRVTAAGLAVGVVGALALTRVLGSLLFEVPATDPVTFTLVTVTLGGVAFLAAWLPARRASRVDPMVALLSE